jgi:hypothetical protein
MSTSIFHLDSFFEDVCQAYKFKPSNRDSRLFCELGQHFILFYFGPGFGWFRFRLYGFDFGYHG